MEDRLLTTRQVAARVGDVSESTVRYWRHTGYGPQGFRVGRRVLYPETEVDRWLRSLREAEQPQGAALGAEPAPEGPGRAPPIRSTPPGSGPSETAARTRPTGGRAGLAAAPHPSMRRPPSGAAR